MTDIHPTAVVHPKAEIGEGVRIGPYAVIGENVRIGRGTEVASHALIDGWTEIGENCRIFSFAAVGTIPQDLKFRGEESRVRIGDRNTVREYVTVNLGTAGGGGVTTIGSGCLLMANSHVGHDCAIGDGAIIANSVALAGHVTLEDHVHLSGLAAAHQFTRIGRLALNEAFVGNPFQRHDWKVRKQWRCEQGGLVRILHV